MSQHVIPITNGKGTKEITNGTYDVTGEFTGYDNSSILPATQEISEGVNEYSFTIAATGKLTLHVTDDGTDVGVPIEGATFIRCDAEGNTYGNPVTSDVDGNAVFEHVPFAAYSAPAVYYKQTASDGEHEFSDELRNTTLTEENVTVEIENSDSTERTFTITDANYENLPIADGNITISEQ